MLIGIDGNEANVMPRVGSNQYAYEILKEFHRLNSKSEIRSSKKEKTQFLIYLKSSPLPDMPKKAPWWQYRVITPQRLWTQVRLPLELYLGRPRPDVFFSPGHYSPRFLPMPLVCSIMDLGYLRFPEQFKPKDLYTMKKWTARCQLKKLAIF
jgi:hypothetical protein